MALAPLTHRIHAWLADDAAAYADGVALLREAGTAPGLARMLARGEDPRRWARLQQALRAALSGAPSAEGQAPTRPPEPATASRATPAALAQAMPPEIRAVDAAWRQHYKRAADVFRDLKRATSDRTRAAYAAEILCRMDQVREGWRVVDHWRETGRAPEPEPSAEGRPDPEQAARAVAAQGLRAVVQRLINLPTYQTKHRQRAKRAAAKGDAARAADHLALAQAYAAEREALFNLLDDAEQALGSRRKP